MLVDERLDLRNPFDAAADPRQCYFDAQRRQTSARLLSSLYEGSGLTLLVGAEAIGKSTLLRHLADELEALEGVVLLHPSGVFSCRSDTTLGDILAACRTRLATPGISSDPLRVARDLQLIAESNRTPVLLLDDADRLGSDVLDGLVTLSALQASDRRLLSTVLGGRPELAARLATLTGASEGSLVHRTVRLWPLPEAEVGKMIRHRLRAAGRPVPGPFDAETISRIAAESGGVPGAVVEACRRVLDRGPHASPTLPGATTADPAVEHAGTRSSSTAGDLPASLIIPAQPSPTRFATPPRAETPVPPPEPFRPHVALDGGVRGDGYHPEAAGKYRGDAASWGRRPRSGRRYGRAAIGAASATALIVGALALFGGEDSQQDVFAERASTTRAFDPTVMDQSPPPIAPAEPMDHWWRDERAALVPGLPDEEPAAPAPADASSTVAPSSPSPPLSPLPFESTSTPEPAPATPAAPEPPAGPSASLAAPAPRPPAAARTQPEPSPRVEASARATPSPAAAPQGQANRRRDIQALIAEGDARLAEGDVAAARSAYEQAFDKGSGDAARRLARTFDPRDAAADSPRVEEASPEEAILWYQDAIRRGDRRAKSELDELTGWLEQNAAGGDAEAQRVLETWRAGPEDSGPEQPAD